jgi:outer membrane protein assembly factor BamA
MAMRAFAAAALAVLLGLHVAAFAGATEDREAQGVTGETGMTAERAREDTTLTDWMVFPAAFYTPETGIGGGATWAYFFRDSLERHPSSLMGVLFYTEKRQIITSAVAEMYLREWVRWLRLEVNYLKFPNTYYGIGNDTQLDLAEDYTSEVAALRVIAQRLIRTDIRLGPEYAFRHEVLYGFDEGGDLETRQIPGSENHIVSRLGARLTWDTRDNIYYSRGGRFFETTALFSGRALGSDYSFAKLVMDLRQFLASGQRHTLALRAYLAVLGGTAPFQDLPSLGGSKLMRGYPEGRYRDNAGAVLQAEYRLLIWWRLGMTVFGSLGQVSDTVGNLPSESLRYAGGFGIRFRMTDDGFNLRLDTGFTEEGSNFYIVAGEAF